MDKIINILFCGTGGQGVLKAAEICALAAVYNGYNVKKSEVHGMSQRGGSVESHVRFGNKVYSPIIEIGKADFLVPFYKSEHDRMINYLSADSKDLLESLLLADKELKDKRFVNTYMLGVLAKYLNFKEESWIQAIEVGFNGKMMKENIEIFLGAKNFK